MPVPESSLAREISEAPAAVARQSRELREPIHALAARLRRMSPRVVVTCARGSSAHAAAGWQQAAYQRNTFYFPPGGGAQWAVLTPEQPSQACYTLTLAAAAAPWGVYFFYGGPGGVDC